MWVLLSMSLLIEHDVMYIWLPKGWLPSWFVKLLHAKKNLYSYKIFVWNGNAYLITRRTHLLLPTPKTYINKAWQPSLLVPRTSKPIIFPCLATHSVQAIPTIPRECCIQ